MIRDEKTRNGMLAQMYAEQRATELGYMVSRPATECCRYDMIIDNGTDLKRIQVKYCNIFDGKTGNAVKLLLGRGNRKRLESYSSDEVDAVVVYVAPIKRLCYLPIELVEGKRNIRLHINRRGRKRRDSHYCDEFYW